MHLRTTPLMIALIALAGCGGDAAVRAYNDALAALEDGELQVAAETADRAASIEVDDIAADIEFLRGSIKWAQCEIATLQAASVEAEPFALAVAIRYAVAARDRWQSAVRRRPDWTAAAENVERALLRIRELESQREPPDSQKEPGPKPDPRPAPAPDEPPAPRPEEGGTPVTAELSPEEVARLFELLAEKEREKRTLRRSVREARMRTVERDW